MSKNSGILTDEKGNEFYPIASPRRFDVSNDGNTYTNPLAWFSGASTTGMIGIRLGQVDFQDCSMITVKGHIYSYQSSVSFSASTYLYLTQGYFYAPVCEISNNKTLNNIYFAEDSNYNIWIILGTANTFWSFPGVYIEDVHVGWQGEHSTHWLQDWEVQIFTDTSTFRQITECKQQGALNRLNCGFQTIGISAVSNMSGTTTAITMLKTSIPSSGLWLFTANVPINFYGQSGRELWVKLKINDTEIDSAGGVLNTYGYTIKLNMTCIAPANTGDTLKIEIQDASGKTYTTSWFPLYMVNLSRTD